MQTTCRRPSTSTPKARVSIIAPKVDFRTLLSSLRPELLRNPLLAPPKSALLVARRPSCLKLKSSRPATSLGKGPLTALTPRTKSYTLLTTIYSPRPEPSDPDPLNPLQPPSNPPPIPPNPYQIPRKYPPNPLEDPPLPSENSSMLVDRQQLAAVFSGETGDMRSQYAQAEIYETETLPTHIVTFPAAQSAYWKPPIARSRTIKSAIPGKRLVRAHSQVEFTPMSVSIRPSLIADSLQQRLFSAKSRVSSLKSLRSATMATQTLDSAHHKGKIDVYLPEDLHI